MRDAVQKIDHLLTTRPPLPPVTETSLACHHALEQYQDRKSLIEADLYQSQLAQKLPATTSHYQSRINQINHELTSNIVAALALGDIHFADIAVTWLDTFLNNHQVVNLPLCRYLAAYQQAASIHLNATGMPIVSWLERWANH